MLAEFFDAAIPWLRGECAPDALRTLGGTPASAADLAFYPALTRYGYHCTLRELFGPVATLVEQPGGPGWDRVCDAFFRAHPPGGWLLQDLGEPFPAWLERHLAGATFLDPVLDGVVSTAAAIASVADHLACRGRARHAADGPGVCLDERVFVRQYPVDVVALARDPRAAGVGVTVTVCVFRDLRDDLVKLDTPTVATMAVFADLLGHPRTGALAISEASLAAERDRLVRIGVLDAAEGSGASQTAP